MTFFTHHSIVKVQLCISKRENVNPLLLKDGNVRGNEQEPGRHQGLRAA